MEGGVALALTLKGQVEAVSGAEVAQALPSATYEKWLVFATAPAPQLVFYPGKGVFLAKPRPEATQAETYAFFFEPVFVVEGGNIGQFKLKCKAACCGALNSYAVRKFVGEEEIEWAFPFKNALMHLQVCPGRPPPPARGLREGGPR